MKLIARAPIERNLGGAHARPGDTFEHDDVEFVRGLVASGEADVVEGAALMATADATTNAPAEAPKRRGRPPKA